MSTPALLALVVALPLAAACGEDDGHDHTFDTFAACVAGHADPMAIAHCLIDYDFEPTLADQAACEAYVAGEGYDASATEACELYFEQL